MIFIVTEQVMNGTVTMAIITIGIEADTFNQTVAKLKQQGHWDMAKVLSHTDSKFTYQITDGMTVYGYLCSQPLKII